MTERLDRRAALSLILAAILILTPPVRRVGAAPQDRGGPGQGDTHKDDPCTHLPDPAGNANGIEKQCPGGGSSNGIAKGDFNGDGYADLAVAEPEAMVGGQAGAGDVIVLPGSATGLTVTGRQLWYEGRIAVTGPPAAGDGFGTALASGDFNGDGFSDLAIGIPGRDVVFQGNTYHNWGRVVVLYGSQTGLTTDHSAIFDFSQHYTLRDGHAKEGARLGKALSWGDFNGDGTGDLAIGAPHYTLDRGLFNTQKTEAGAVWMLHGVKKTSTAFGGLTAASSLVFQADDIAGVHGNQAAFPYEDDSQSGDHFGAMLAAGDFNGDSRSDLAIAAPDKVHTFCALVFCSTTINPILYDLAGSSAGIVLTLRGEHYGFDFPQGFLGSIAAGDFNGDGKTDLAVGDPTNGPDFFTGGNVAVYYGQNATTILDTAVPEFVFNQHEVLGGGPHDFGEPGAQFGAALATGDFNSDGYADLAIGVPSLTLEDDNANYLLKAGGVYVIYGSSGGLSPERASFVTASNPASGDHFGVPLTAWNFGRDECCDHFGSFNFAIRTSDLVVGMPLKTVKGVSGAGEIHVFYGSRLLDGIYRTFNPPDIRQIFNADNIGLGGLTGAHFGGGLY